MSVAATESPESSIVNVALPSLSINLGATTRELQWIVDAYLLVFTGPPLAAGGLGDRYGRKRSLVFGLIAFGAMSVYAGSVDSAGELITSAFFALFGFIFLITQYFQLVRHHPRVRRYPRRGDPRFGVSSTFAARFLPARAVENPDLLPA